MQFQINEVILWPKNTTFEPRRLIFKAGVVNVISGVSRTGKSAIIPIIDYCLGSGRCTIPVNTIRDACEWFGILVQTGQGKKLLARREPGQQKTTGDMFLLEGAEIEVPREIVEKNTNAETIKHLLDELAGLTALDFDFDGTGSGFKYRPSFRDLSAFIFQPQNIVANPNVLFYKADTHEHREKLRTIFPYVLDAESPELLAKRHELTQLKRILKRKESDLQNVRQVSERWLAEISSHVSQAREFGLIEATDREVESRDESLELLRGVVRSTASALSPTDDSISRAISELTKLNEEERSLSLRMSVLRQRNAEMSALKASATLYKGALQIQQERLAVSEWITKTHTENHDCPVCGNLLDGTEEKLQTLQDSLREIEKEAGNFSSIPAAFDREFERVRAEMEVVSEKLQGTRFRVRELERTSEEAQKKQYDSLAVSRFIGRVEQAIQTFAAVGTDSDLSDEVNSLKERIAILEQYISEGAIQAKQKRALQSVNLNAGRLLPLLDVERPNDPVELSLTDLTVKVIGASREDYLWEIGSGSNWLAYHIAITLGLHQFFMDLKSSPVPTFIVYDQPSQVYFPKHLREDFDETVEHPEWKDDDVEALHKVFDVLSSVVKKNESNFQIIVLDHAPDYLWKDLEGIFLAEEWRGGKKLVPEEWLNSD